MNVVDKRIRHVKSHIDTFESVDFNEQCIQNLLSGSGSRTGSLGNLVLYSHAMAIYSWFANKDIRATKNWFFTMASLQLAKMSQMSLPQRRGAFSLSDASAAAYSDYPGVRRKIGGVLEPLYSQEGDDPIFDFLAVQAGLILRGEIESARSALERTINNVSFGASRRAVDICVFDQIHHGSDDDLRRSILRICELTDQRLDMEGGYTEGLMNSDATFYAKLCRIAGRSIDIEHPMIPNAWLEDQEVMDPVFMLPRLINVVFESWR